ncbi:hypothetical protein [Ectopseudomonas oleovorans]|uniref:hypothetical protein n=1 Tax=Ectopseudomonas oleovorans TaxID=301 RepID=UPI003F1C8C22
MDDLLAQAEAFKRINIEFTGFEQSAQYLEQQAKELAERLKKYMVIPVNYVGADGKALSEADKKAAEVLGTDPVKRAAGGWVDGPGSPTSDSVLLAASRREFVVNAWAAQRLGAANLEYLNSTGELPQRAVNLPEFPDFRKRSTVSASVSPLTWRCPGAVAMRWKVRRARFGVCPMTCTMRAANWGVRHDASCPGARRHHHLSARWSDPAELRAYRRQHPGPAVGWHGR